MNLWERLDALDRGAFLAINGAYAPWCDVVMEAVSSMVLWFPLYIFFLYLLQRRFGWKGLGWSVLVIALMILCSDKGSVMLFKETVQRLRPCHEPALQGLVHLVPEGCGGQFGFISSHASNHFAIVLFMISALRLKSALNNGEAILRRTRSVRGVEGWAAYALLLWATLICYSRVYLGVHYPGDVLAGALYGALVGAIFAWIHRTVMARTSTA